MQMVCGFLAEWDINLDARASPRRQIDIEQPVDQFRPFAQVDHPQAAALVVGLIHRRHIKANAIVFDLQQRDPWLERLEPHPDMHGSWHVCGHCWRPLPRCKRSHPACPFPYFRG